MAFVQAAIVAAFAFVLLGSMGLFRQGKEVSTSSTSRKSLKSTKVASLKKSSLKKSSTKTVSNKSLKSSKSA